MVNMKLSRDESNKAVAIDAKPGDGPAYPWGLTLHLDTDTLKKLGYDAPPAVGSELTLSAKVTVTSVGVNQQQDGDKEQRAELQITDMELAGAGPDATALFSNSNMNP